MEIKKYLESCSNYYMGDISSNIELEIRFGKYDKISSNLSSDIFADIYKLSGSQNKHKQFYYIKESLYVNDRRRITYTDINESIATIFDNVDLTTISSLLELVVKFSKEKPTFDVIVSKNAIKKPLLGFQYKISINSENILQVPKSEPNIIAYRHKFRCSWEVSSWIYDITIMLFDDIATNKKKIYYEVELELNIKHVQQHKNSVDFIYSELSNYIYQILNIIECNSFKSHIDYSSKLGNFNSVVTLGNDNINRLIQSRYAVVDKADGERKFIYIDSNGHIYQANPTDKIVEKKKIDSNSNIKCINTIIDCELINDTMHGFDLLFYNGVDCRNLNLSERLSKMAVVIKELSQLQKSGSKKNPGLGIKFVSKKFYFDDIFKNADYIWKNRKKLFKYNLDGLIFTPIHGSYLGNLPNLKWKEKHSIDVRIFFNRNDNFTEFYPNSPPIIKNGHVINSIVINGKSYYKSRITLNEHKYKDANLVNKYGILGVAGQLNYPDMQDIHEFEYDNESKQWIYLRKRNDKDIPNAFLSIKSVMNSICDNITIDKISKLLYKPSVYETIGINNKNCFSKYGFSFTIQDTTNPICQFYTFAYNNIIKSFKGKRILTLGCDICLLNALLQSTYTDITIVEDSCLNIYGTTESEGYLGLDEYLKNNLNSKSSKTINLFWGDSTLSNGLKTYNKPDQPKLDKLYAKKWDMIFINIFELSFFNQQTKKFDIKMLNNYMSILNTLKNKTATIVCLVLSVDNISKILEKQPCVVMRDGGLNPLYKLMMRNKDPVHSNTNIIEVQRLRNGFFTEYQPILPDKQLIDLLKKNGVKIKESNSINSYHSYFKTSEQLSEYDIIISTITKYIIFTI